MTPVLAITDTEDARLVFDLLNKALTDFTADYTDEERKRLCVLLIAAHADMIRTDTDTDTEGH